MAAFVSVDEVRVLVAQQDSLRNDVNTLQTIIQNMSIKIGQLTAKFTTATTQQNHYS